MALIINYVWLGCGALGQLEKFNIYCWRAKGHAVAIYTHHFTSGTSHTVNTLGLEAGDADVYVMPTVLGEDDEMLPLPPGWEKTFWGEPMPNVVRWIRESRRGH